MLLTIFLLLLTLFFSAIFSGMEIAFVSLNKIELELVEKQNNGIRYLKYFRKNPDLFLGAILVGNNLMLVIFGGLLIHLLDPLLLKILPVALSGSFVLLIIRTILATFVILLFAEFIPKNLFRINPSGKLLFLIIPFSFALFPFLVVPAVIVIAISRLLFGKPLPDRQDSTVGFTHLELQDYIERTAEQSEQSDDIDTQMVEKALELKETLARECMIPRNHIVAVDENDPFEKRKELFIESNHSKIILYHDDIDHPTGYAFHQDILKNSSNKYELLFYPESELVTSILKAFIENKKSIALIVDEYGGTAGLITMEDIVEEIFGEIEDEHDKSGLLCREITANRYEFSGRVEIDSINEKFGLQIPEGDYETIGGFILEHHKAIPKQNKSIRIDHFRFFIQKASATKIDVVELKVDAE